MLLKLIYVLISAIICSVARKIPLRLKSVLSTTDCLETWGHKFIDWRTDSVL